MKRKRAHDSQIESDLNMRGSRNFRQGGGGGGPGQSDKKKRSDVGFFSVFFFFFFFLVLSLIYRSQMVNFKEIYHFSRSQMGSHIFQGGSNFFQGGGGGPIANFL